MTVRALKFWQKMYYNKNVYSLEVLRVYALAQIKQKGHMPIPSKCGYILKSKLYPFLR